MKKYLKIWVITLFMLLFLVPITYAGGIQGQLTFTAETVYYEDNTVVVYGYWFNDTNKYIPYTNWVSMDVYAINRTFQECIASGQFTQRSYLYLKPGEAKYWTYRIHNCPIKPLPHWRVDTTVNYHWQNSEFDL